MSFFWNLSNFFEGISGFFNSADFPLIGSLLRDPAEAGAGVSMALDGALDKNPYEMAHGGVEIAKVTAENLASDALASALSHATGATLPGFVFSDVLEPLANMAAIRAEYEIHKNILSDESIFNQALKETSQLLEHTAHEANDLFQSVFTQQQDILETTHAQNDAFFHQNFSYENAPEPFSAAFGNDPVTQQALEASLSFNDQLIEQNLQHEQQWNDHGSAFSYSQNDNFTTQNFDTDTGQNFYTPPNYSNNDY